MEGTTVSPSPASPTEGDDLCDIDVTDVAVDSVTLLICLCGLAGNGAVLCLLQRRPTTCYIINLAFANFSFLHFAVLSTLLYLLEDVSCSTIVPLVFLRALFPLLLFSYNLGLYLLTAISIDRCTSILCLLWCRSHCPQRLSWVVCALLWALSITVIVTMTALCHSQEHEHCQVSLITMYALNLFLFAPAMVISSTILLIKVKCVSQQQRPKRLDIVICHAVLFFLLFALPLSLSNFLQQLGYTVVASQVVFLLTCIHSTVIPFICFVVGRCWRHCSVESLRLSLQRVFEEPEENTARSDDPAMDTDFPAC
ncbi:mas-related G-protein coupled receptor member H-like [Motacilla alba alba]|uniref:mas-related G-protein coupled receptor member H-like n=1 Tax=Motacilla alba alba TaxID=1094192 RepID=UPI0018D4F0CD|nr:mas-related G-protein coupled receptor member H-like [Motacilla alba alba]XP_037994810.1 mas-related G-protein coupled receptor member H-like [Motacilla alba alba]